MRSRAAVSTGRLLTGLILMGLGGLFLLDQIDLIQIGPLWRLWPIALVLVGLAGMLNPERRHKFGGHFTVMMMGLLFLAIEFHWMALTWSHSWSIIIAIVGLGIVLEALFTVRTGLSPDEEKKDGPHA